MDIIDLEGIETTGRIPIKNSIKCNPSSNLLCYITIPIATLAALITIVFVCRNYIKLLLFWIDVHQDSWIIILIVITLFTIVSFPIVIGYLILIIACGYIFGIVRGIIMVLLGANLGIIIAHSTLKVLSNKLPIVSVLKSETAKAILRVITGPQAFKVVLLARLTPIPFGLQNTIFAMSNISGIRYHIASAIGLFPAQMINVYLGSSVRSMQDVLENKSATFTGYIVFCIQILIGISLMIYVVQKARRELHLALLEADLASMTYHNDIITDSKVILSNSSLHLIT